MKFIYLSHFLNNDSPCYGGGNDFFKKKKTEIKNNDSTVIDIERLNLESRDELSNLYNAFCKALTGIDELNSFHKNTSLFF